jgi:hypothetical protein
MGYVVVMMMVVVTSDRPETLMISARVLCQYDNDSRDDIQEECIMSGELRTITQEDRVDVAFQQGTHAPTGERGQDHQ